MRATLGDAAQWVVFDLDGTICDTEHRQEFAAAKDWDGFHSRLMKDQPVYGIQVLLKAMWRMGLQIGLATGRPEKYRKDTCDWLDWHGIPFHTLIMRRDGDFRPDTDVKREMFLGERIVFVVEDRARVVEMWRARGELCLAVAKGDY
jgi:phosphoglycolate phosphatase-like HAD superfamily hydrolase